MDIYTTSGKKEIIKRYTPKSPIAKNTLFAFLTGGGICSFAELLKGVYTRLGASDSQALTGVSVTIIFLSSLLSALGVFDRIGRVAGAGTLVPICGFSNAVTSAALDSQSEGFVLGLGSKIFTVAGPVILYGLFSGFLYGVIYYIYLYIIR